MSSMPSTPRPSYHRMRKQVWKRPSNLCAKGEGLMQALYFANPLRRMDGR